MNIKLYQKIIKIISSLQYLFLSFLIYKNTISGILNLILILTIGQPFPFVNTVINYTLVVLLVCLFLTNKLRINITSISIITCYCLLLIVTFIVNPVVGNNLHYIIPSTFLNIIVFLLFVPSLNNSKKIYKYLRLFMPLSVFYCLLEFFVFLLGYELDYMAFSYAIIIPLMISLYDCFFLRNKYSAFSLIIMLPINLICGARGSFICIFFFVFVLIFKYLNFIKKIILLLFFLFLLILYYVLPADNYISYVSKIIPNSRSLKLISSSRIFYLAKREFLYEFLYTEIKNNPNKFRGLYSDRFDLAKHFGKKGIKNILASYSHNIILEIIYQFGFFIGSIIILFCFCFIIFKYRRLNNKKDSYESLLFIISCSYAFGQLMFSNSYLTAISFGLMISVLISNRNHYYIIGDKY